MPAVVQEGATVEVEKFPGAWYAAVVLQANPTDAKVMVHYDGWSTQWDEWVDLSKIKGGAHPEAPSSAATAPAVTVSGLQALKDEMASLREHNKRRKTPQSRLHRETGACDPGGCCTQSKGDLLSWRRQLQRRHGSLSRRRAGQVALLCRPPPSPRLCRCWPRCVHGHTHAAARSGWSVSSR
jgi:hypothetical protein